jgi:ABC-type transport system involved in multi-copper enzyme maturation permease subunit
MTPTAPSFGHSVATIFRLQFRRILRGNRLWIAIGATVLIDLALLLVRYLGPDGVEAANVVKGGISLGYFTLLVYLVPFLLMSGSMVEEIDGRTWAYLATRPVSRWAITIGKYSAGVVFAVAVLVGGLLVLHLGSFITEPTPLFEELAMTGRCMGGLTLLVLLYGGILLFWGAVVPEASGLVAGIHFALVEFFVGMMPTGLRFGSMNYLASQIGGLPKSSNPLLAESIPDLALWIPFIPLTLEIGLFLALASIVISSSEFRFGRA